MKEHQITYNNEILDGKSTNRSFASNDDIVKKNALILIAKHFNKAKNIEKIEKNIKEHIGSKNMVSFFFKRNDKFG